MSCEEVSRWIGPLLDGELDARNASDVQAHLAACPACKRRYEAERALSSSMKRLDLAYTAPESLRHRITEALEVPRATHANRGSSRWIMLAGWPIAAVASALLATVLLQQRSQEADDIVAAHVRSLLVNHLNDVISTDRHTVKPWFAGKIGFAPPVPDLSSLGFELLGGRLDYLQGQPVAAVVYRKHGHIINVLISLQGHDSIRLPHTTRVRGYSLRSWHQAGLELVAVSDIDPLELANLEHGYTMS